METPSNDDRPVADAASQEAETAHDTAVSPPDLSNGFDEWRRRSAIGNVGTGVARGLQAVFAPPREEPVIVAEAPGEPPDQDQRLRVILDPDDPTKSIAVVPHQPDVPPSA